MSSSLPFQIHDWMLTSTALYEPYPENCSYCELLGTIDMSPPRNDILQPSSSRPLDFIAPLLWPLDSFYPLFFDIP